MTRFSIITVVRNDPVGVIRTLQSVFRQTYPDYEVIVQDGASTDETSDILRCFGNWIDDLAIEPDDGIYDAMNRALRRATGDYLLFLNAADFFEDDTVLERVSQQIDPERDDIWVGTAIDDETGRAHPYRSEDEFWAGSTLDHQAAFIRTNLAKDLEYDSRYKIAGDLHFFARARKKNTHLKQGQMVIARKSFGVGISSNFIDRLPERLSILEDIWGKEYPVRQVITNELCANLAEKFGISPSYLEHKTAEELLIDHQRWVDLLGLEP